MPNMPKNAIKPSLKDDLLSSNPSLSADNSANTAHNRAFFILEQSPVVKTVVNKSTYRKRFMAYKRYKKPLIIRSKNGDWHVEYKFEKPDEPGNFKKFKVRDGINYIHDQEQKEKAIRELQKDILRELKKGYNPFAVSRALTFQAQDVVQKVEHEEEQKRIDEANKKWTLEKAIVKFNEYCVWKQLSANTIKTYRAFMNNFTEWLTDAGHLQFIASEYLEDELIKFLDVYHDHEEWSPRTYNNHLSFFITFFGRSEKLEKKEDRNIKYKIDLVEPDFKVDTAEKNRYYSPEVAKIVKKELNLAVNWYLKKYIKWIYLSCMRPREIRLLKLQHINLEARQIKAIGPTAKTGDRYVPISDELLDLIKEFKIEKYSPNDYLFGKYGTPGPVMFAVQYFSIIYLAIKRKLNLDKNYTMYSWKHTRVINLLGAGFSDEAVKQLTGHRDDKSFQAYKRDLIPNQSSLMKGKTTAF